MSNIAPYKYEFLNTDLQASYSIDDTITISQSVFDLDDYVWLVNNITFDEYWNKIYPTDSREYALSKWNNIVRAVNKGVLPLLFDQLCFTTQSDSPRLYWRADKNGLDRQIDYTNIGYSGLLLKNHINLKCFRYQKDYNFATCELLFSHIEELHTPYKISFYWNININENLDISVEPNIQFPDYNTSSDVYILGRTPTSFWSSYSYEPAKYILNNNIIDFSHANQKLFFDEQVDGDNFSCYYSEIGENISEYNFLNILVINPQKWYYKNFDKIVSEQGDSHYIIPKDTVVKITTLQNETEYYILQQDKRIDSWDSTIYDYTKCATLQLLSEFYQINSEDYFKNFNIKGIPWTSDDSIDKTPIIDKTKEVNSTTSYRNQVTDSVIGKTKINLTTRYNDKYETELDTSDKSKWGYLDTKLSNTAGKRYLKLKTVYSDWTEPVVLGQNMTANSNKELRSFWINSFLFYSGTYITFIPLGWKVKIFKKTVTGNIEDHTYPICTKATTAIQPCTLEIGSNIPIFTMGYNTSPYSSILMKLNYSLQWSDSWNGIYSNCDSNFVKTITYDSPDYRFDIGKDVPFEEDGIYVHWYFEFLPYTGKTSSLDTYINEPFPKVLDTPSSFYQYNNVLISGEQNIDNFNFYVTTDDCHFRRQTSENTTYISIISNIHTYNEASGRLPKINEEMIDSGITGSEAAPSTQYLSSDLMIPYDVGLQKDNQSIYVQILCRQQDVSDVGYAVIAYPPDYFNN